MCPSAGSVWRHYKGGDYVILHQAIDDRTLEPVIVYRCLDGHDVWLRTPESWYKPQDGRQRFVSWGRICPTEDR
jgi:hypothetical protein